jgi:protoheme IX farnesyltransferase
MKYRHWTCTIVGAVPGAIPPVIGWSAATGEAVAPNAWILFAILFCWQMPHFFAIGWMYRDEYARAGIAILPVADSDDMQWTSRSIFAWSILLTLAVLAPALAGSAGVAYFVCASLLSVAQFILAHRLRRERSRDAARSFFLWSIAYLPAVLGALVIDAALR